MIKEKTIMISKISFLSSIEEELNILDKNLRTMIEARHPILYAAAEHLFSAGGKRIRPAIVLLVAQATKITEEILPVHKRLAEITEIIHTASLLHDDVIDECSTRRGIKTVHNTFSTKIAVLAGDFLFAQSSWYLANLEKLEVVKSISKVIIDFAEGEVRQGMIHFDSSVSLQEYVEKSFYKTASLVAASCKGAVMLSLDNNKIANILYFYGYHLGLAFQIIDDILDIIVSSNDLGKPAGLDLKNGNLTAPIFFSLIEKPILSDLIEREFYNTDDLNNALKLIKLTNGIIQAKDLASEHIQAAISCLDTIDHLTEVKNLKYLSYFILNRLK